MWAPLAIGLFFVCVSCSRGSSPVAPVATRAEHPPAPVASRTAPALARCADLPLREFGRDALPAALVDVLGNDFAEGFVHQTYDASFEDEMSGGFGHVRGHLREWTVAQVTTLTGPRAPLPLSTARQRLRERGLRDVREAVELDAEERVVAAELDVEGEARVFLRFSAPMRTLGRGTHATLACVDSPESAPLTVAEATRLGLLHLPSWLESAVAPDARLVYVGHLGASNVLLAPGELDAVRFARSLAAAGLQPSAEDDSEWSNDHARVWIHPDGFSFR